MNAMMSIAIFAIILAMEAAQIVKLGISTLLLKDDVMALAQETAKNVII